MLATVINFSTNELAFLNKCVREALCFSSQVIVCFADHFFDGTRENLPLIYGAAKQHPEVLFVQYPFSEANFYGQHPPSFWHNLSRLIGSFYSEKQWVLFLDVDEVAEGERFARWLTGGAIKEWAAVRLANYWYFREARFRANTIEDTPLLVRKEALTYEAIMQEKERAGLFARVEGKKERMVGKHSPFFHHYSWVRSKEEMLKKVASWGHRHERDWKTLVEAEFAKDFSGTDFVHGYAFEKVESILEPGMYLPIEAAPENVKILSTRDVHKIDLQIQCVL